MTCLNCSPVTIGQAQPNREWSDSYVAGSLDSVDAFLAEKQARERKGWYAKGPCFLTGRKLYQFLVMHVQDIGLGLDVRSEEAVYSHFKWGEDPLGHDSAMFEGGRREAERRELRPAGRRKVWSNCYVGGTLANLDVFVREVQKKKRQGWTAEAPMIVDGQRLYQFFVKYVEDVGVGMDAATEDAVLLYFKQGKDPRSHDMETRKARETTAAQAAATAAMLRGDFAAANPGYAGAGRPGR